jgi:hypothetical protein
MTGHYATDVVEERIQGLGVEVILKKPVMITTLMNEVNKILHAEE